MNVSRNQQEIRDRMNHFYRQTDGSMLFPNSAEGDLLKMTFRLFSELTALTCEWTVTSAFFSDVSTAACTGFQYGEELDDAVFCPNCGNRIKFITKQP